MKTSADISLTVLVLLAATPIWGQTAPVSSTEPRAVSPTTLPAEVPPTPSSRLAVEASRRQLSGQWRSSPDNKSDSTDLQQAVDQLMRVMNKAKPPVETVVSDPPAERLREPTTRPATTQPATTQPGPTTRPTTRPSSANLAEHIKKLNRIEDPGAVADALFQAKRPDLAGMFYARALKAPAPAKKKAWLLFQIGNCNRKSDPQGAIEAYDTLLAAHGDTIWSDIALVQKTIIEWRNTNNIAALLEDIEKQGRQPTIVSERK